MGRTEAEAMAGEVPEEAEKAAVVKEGAAMVLG